MICREFMVYEKISVIIPLYNEEKSLEKLLFSISHQEYDYEFIEIIFVDGNSKDNTRNIINDHISKSEHKVKLLDNPKKRIPMAFNIGIRNASNDIILILNAHSEYPSNYFKDCVSTLINSGAHNVGGIIDTITDNDTLEGKAIKYLTSSIFGVGNSKFRTSKKNGKVDTVLFFCFHKELVNKIGFFDERIFRNQDNEFNYRLKKNGYKLWQNSEIVVRYHNVSNLKKLFYQAFVTGKWNTWTMVIRPVIFNRHPVAQPEIRRVIVDRINSLLYPEYRFFNLLRD
jgi:glycosyltransferase involved in cell wall biosynthesis